MKPTEQATRGQPPFGVPRVPQMNPFLALLPEEYWPRDKQFFQYTPKNGPVNLAASAVKAQTDIALSTDSDFLLMAVSGIAFSTDDTTILTDPPFDIGFIDGSTGQLISNDLVHWGTTVGSAKEPFYFPYPRILGGGSVFSILLTNLSATARHVSLTFSGFKIFNRPSA